MKLEKRTNINRLIKVKTVPGKASGPNTAINSSSK